MGGVRCSRNEYTEGKRLSKDIEVKTNKEPAGVKTLEVRWSQRPASGYRKANRQNSNTGPKSEGSGPMGEDSLPPTARESQLRGSDAQREDPQRMSRILNGPQSKPSR